MSDKRSWKRIAEIKSIPLGKIVVTGDNPRQAFDLESLGRLGDSIESHGLLQPIIVRPIEDHYELVVGERRFRAVQLKGMDEIVARVDELDDTTCMELRLIENTHREDLTDAEKGDAIYSLMAKYPEKYSTIKSVADSVNKPYGTVLQWTTKSRKLSDHVRELIVTNSLVEAQASYLMKYDHHTQNRLADAIVHNELSSVITPKFLKLYDAEPEADLEDLANEAKGVKKVEIEVEKLSEAARKEVEDILAERAKNVEEARERALEKAWKAPRRSKSSTEDVAARKAVEGVELEDVSVEGLAEEALKRAEVSRGEEGLDVVPLWQAMEDLKLPPEVESSLINNIRNAERQYELGKVILKQKYDEWELNKLIELAAERPELSVETLVEAVNIEGEKRRKNKYLTLEVGYKVWEALDAEAEKRRGPTGRLEIMAVATELLDERLKGLGHSTA